MNLFHFYMQGASRAAIDAGQPLIDEDLSIIIDAGFIYMIEHPDASKEDAILAGANRFNFPTL